VEGGREEGREEKGEKGEGKGEGRERRKCLYKNFSAGLTQRKFERAIKKLTSP
jgi:hypothetical protein